jgi:hypothetical protein
VRCGIGAFYKRLGGEYKNILIFPAHRPATRKKQGDMAD